MIRAALAGALDEVPVRRDPVFNLEVPLAVPGVPAGLLTPRETWPDQADYDAQASRLARMFADNFATYASGVTSEVRGAGPQG
jgi:phosphoenolpyruvate carboxykinase (ATP)